MLRTFLALMAFVIALHAATPANRSEAEAVQVISMSDGIAENSGDLDWPDESDDSGQVAAHATTKCHDQCNGFTMSLSQNFLRKSPLPIESRATKFPPASIAIVVPPPRPAG